MSQCMRQTLLMPRKLVAFSDRICALHLRAPGALEIFVSLKSAIYPLYYDDICT